MCPFSDHNIRLFVLDLAEKVRKMFYFRFQGIVGHLVLRNVHNTMHVEADLFAARRPVFVAEAVFEFAVLMGVEAVVARRNTALVDEVFARGIENLETRAEAVSIIPNKDSKANSV